METSLKNLIKGDRVIWTVLLFLSLLSMLIVYSATGALAFRQAGGNTLYFLVRQMVFLGLGFGLILLMVNVIQVKFYSIISRVVVIGSILLLGLAIGMKITGLAGDSTGRALNLGFLSFQPAEVAKLGLIMFTAKMLGIEQNSKDGLKKAFWRIMIFTAIICAMIAFSNVSTAMLLFATIMSMMFVGRIPFRYLLLVFVMGIAFVAVIYQFGDKLSSISERFPTAQARLQRFVHGDENSEIGITQADYAKLAIFEGGIIGKGPGNSDVANYMAAAYNDFIYAIIIEEYGLIIGGAGVLLLYLIFFFRGVTIVRRANRTFPAFLVTGLTLLLTYQAMINIGVSAGVVPVTGQPLPWVSMGGTSLLFTSVAFGCILSVSYQNQKDKKVEAPAVQVIVPDEDQEMK